jgi:hypothetical protein
LDVKGATLHGHPEPLVDADDGIASNLDAIPDPVELGRTSERPILSVGLDGGPPLGFKGGELGDCVT